MKTACFCIAAISLSIFAAGCGRKAVVTSGSGAMHRHEHKAPHGGTPVVLGAEIFHLEFVLDRPAGKLSVYALDGEMENYIRLTMPLFEVVATVAGAKQPLLFKAVADSATGEKAGDSALFEATAEWLKTVSSFDGVLTKIEIRGTEFTAVAFNFPKGNDKG